ncbi:MAG: phosphoribosyltransferase family protein [Planctomycetota bacterium]|nr:phosphoribosyltransferase family protein [Planctomycetota bacterium]
MIDLAFPKQCLLCKEPVVDGNFCITCNRKLIRSGNLMHSACRRCGVPSASQSFKDLQNDPVARTTPHPSRCIHCKQHDYLWNHLDAMWIYDGLVKDAVVLSKFQHERALANSLGIRLGKLLQRRDRKRPDLITYVPSHFYRRIIRGGEGCRSVAESVAKILGVPCRRIVLPRRLVSKQAWLSHKNRTENMRGAFRSTSCFLPRGTSSLSGKHILVVDDVLTSGATTNEICRVLRRRRAGPLSVAVLARSLPNSSNWRKLENPNS